MKSYQYQLQLKSCTQTVQGWERNKISHVMNVMKWDKLFPDKETTQCISLVGNWEFQTGQSNTLPSWFWVQSCLDIFPLFRSQAESRSFDCHLVLTQVFRNSAISNCFSCPVRLQNSEVWLYFITATTAPTGLLLYYTGCDKMGGGQTATTTTSCVCCFLSCQTNCSIRSSTVYCTWSAGSLASFLSSSSLCCAGAGFTVSCTVGEALGNGDGYCPGWGNMW